MTQGLTGAVTGAASRQANTASTANMTLPAAPMVATYPITGTTTITSITAGQSGKVALLEFASTNCRVVMGGNLLINGDYLSTAGGFLVLVANGSNWEEVDRTSTVIQPYNAVPNGGFEVWQRPFTTGTQFTSPVNNTITADRWYWNQALTGAVVNVLQDTSVPAVAYNMPGAVYSGKINVTTADTSIAAGDVYSYYTSPEGYDIRALANGFAASWWAKAHRTGTYCLSFVNRATNRSYIVEYSITVADTWQYFTAVVPAPTGVWTYDNTIGMYCFFTLAAGSNFIGASANTWLTTFSYATANQINGVAATTDTFSVWGLNVVPGTVPQPYNPMPIALHMGRLRRYCHKIGNGITNERYAPGASFSTTQAYIMVPLPTPLGGPISGVTVPAASNFGLYPNTAAGLQACTAIGSSVSSPQQLTMLATVAGNLPAVNGAVFLMDAVNGGSYILVEWNPA